MKEKITVLLAGSSIAFVASMTASPAAAKESAQPLTAWEASSVNADDDMITTGVARARDRLDSATSTSSMMENDIAKMSATSLGDLFRNIPGMRVEASHGGLNSSYTIRGLPMVADGGKYIQLQEDGLPVLEFGDLMLLGSDIFIRADFNVAQVESIRGGSSSTFASNAPGGVINLVSKTGEVEGGSVQFSSGVNYESYRSDFDYGGHLSDTLRFHVGGFYREGEGPRKTGYNGNHGGQIKFNVTKEFSGGYVRIYGKFLDDTNSYFANSIASVTGTDSNPKYSDLPGFSTNTDSNQSPYIAALPGIDKNNNLTVFDQTDGYHIKAKSIGLEAKFPVAGWSVTERMRYSDQSAKYSFTAPISIIPAAAVPLAFGAPGGSLAYASGPQAGQPINPLTLNGNGLVALSMAINNDASSLNNFTNDLRAGRVWSVGGGDLTTTVGVYNARQETAFDRPLLMVLQDVVGGGNSALINIINANGTPHTQDGVLSYFSTGLGDQVADLSYSIIAPYGSVNFHKGKVAVGASIRVDTGRVNGSRRLNTFPNLTTIDVNNDGIISDAEQTFPIVPLSNTSPVDYNYSYLSYSGSVNYRISENFSTFARYSRGARAGADRIIFSAAIDPIDGSLADKGADHDPVQQAEIGLKYRGNGMFVNFTGFWAKARETNTQLQPDPNTGETTLTIVKRGNRAYGGELEAGIRRGRFSLTGNATFTNAKITASDNPALVGNTPRHQAKLIYQIMPQYETDLFTVGANLIGTTDSYAQDENLLKMPGFTTVNAFLQIRPADRVVVSLNVGNLFDVKALTGVASASIPATGVVLVEPLMGRTISSGIRFYF